MRTVLPMAMALVATSANAETVLSCLGKDARFVLDDDIMVRTIAGVNVLDEPFVHKAREQNFFFDTSTGRLWDGTIEQFFTIMEPPRTESIVMAMYIGTEAEPVFNHVLIIRLEDDKRFIHYKSDEDLITTGKCTVKD